MCQRSARRTAGSTDARRTARGRGPLTHRRLRDRLPVAGLRLDLAEGEASVLRLQRRRLHHLLGRIQVQCHRQVLGQLVLVDVAARPDRLLHFERDHGGGGKRRGRLRPLDGLRPRRRGARLADGEDPDRGGDPLVGGKVALDHLSDGRLHVGHEGVAGRSARGHDDISEGPLAGHGGRHCRHCCGRPRGVVPGTRRRIRRDRGRGWRRGWGCDDLGHRGPRGGARAYGEPRRGVGDRSGRRRDGRHGGGKGLARVRRGDRALTGGLRVAAAPYPRANFAPHAGVPARVDGVAPVPHPADLAAGRGRAPARGGPVARVLQAADDARVGCAAVRAPRQVVAGVGGVAGCLDLRRDDAPVEGGLAARPRGVAGLCDVPNPARVPREIVAGLGPAVAGVGNGPDGPAALAVVHGSRLARPAAVARALDGRYGALVHGREVAGLVPVARVLDERDGAPREVNVVAGLPAGLVTDAAVGDVADVAPARVVAGLGPLARALDHAVDEREVARAIPGAAPVLAHRAVEPPARLVLGDRHQLLVTRSFKAIEMDCTNVNAFNPFNHDSIQSMQSKCNRRDGRDSNAMIFGQG